MSKKLLFIVTILTSSLYAETFKHVNPVPTKTMQENIKNAQPCPNPAPATENISGEFKYGCFCGKNYPIIGDNEPKAYKKLNKQERLEVIEEYYKIKPYDDIDAVCQQHDICYFYKGKNAKSCNEAIHHELRSLVDAFKRKNEIKVNKQCQKLAYDMASVFKTIFTSAETTNNPMEMGILMFNTSITVANKTFEKSLDTFIGLDPLYPPEGHQCLSSSLK